MLQQSSATAGDALTLVKVLIGFVGKVEFSCLCCIQGLVWLQELIQLADPMEGSSWGREMVLFL